MRSVVLIILLFISNFLWAKDSEVGLGIVPELSLSYKFGYYKFSSKVESFQGFYDKTNSSKAWKYVYEQTDLQLFMGRRINPFSSLAVGYQYGIESGDKNTHRIIQQYAYAIKPGAIKWAHRIRADQTFYDDDPVKLRFRYRFSFEVPLQGLSVDYNEFYFVSTNELLYALQDNEQEYEYRLALFSGYFFRNNNKLQFGAEYRVKSTNSSNKQNVWIRLGYIFNI
jgi:hypothetical protein